MSQLNSCWHLPIIQNTRWKGNYLTNLAMSISLLESSNYDHHGTWHACPCWGWQESKKVKSLQVFSWISSSIYQNSCYNLVYVRNHKYHWRIFSFNLQNMELVINCRSLCHKFGNLMQDLFFYSMVSQQTMQYIRLIYWHDMPSSLSN
jgi:hypothetical protein